MSAGAVILGLAGGTVVALVMLMLFGDVIFAWLNLLADKTNAWASRRFGPRGRRKL